MAFLALALASWLVWAAPAPAKITLTTPPMPRRLGPWTGDPVQVEDRVRQILETDDVTLMEYRQDGEMPVWLAQVSGFGSRAAFHPPEVCFVGSHFDVLERGPITVAINGRPQRLMRLVVGQEGKRFEAWYWFTANGRASPSYYQQQWWLLMDSIRRKPLSGSLVRISTPLDDPERAHRRLLAFAEGLASLEQLSTWTKIH